MFEVLANRTYRHLFAAQAIALVGTGLLTVALGLLAYDLAGAEAGAVLGTALAIKMIAYVGVSPVVGGLAGRLPRRAFLISMDLIRAAIALLLPFVTEVWQVYLLIFLLQSASAGFTPTFQATVPDILPEERDYTRALSLSRLAYDLESLLSPALAGLLLTVITFHWLFGGTFVGFIASAALVLSVRLPSPKAAAADGGFLARTTRGLRIYLATPRLRGLLALNLSVAAAGAMVIVNTVIIVRGTLGGDDKDVAIALAFFGGGSMLAALLLPRVLDRTSDRPIMLVAAAALGALLLIFSRFAFGAPEIYWLALLSTWALLGFGYSSILVPTGRLLRRSAHPEDRPALYAAQFSLSHACWLLTYPLAGWLGLSAGIPATLVVLGVVTLAGCALAAVSWPGRDPEILVHGHPDLPATHPHVAAMGRSGRHAHAFVIDELHPAWPARG
jgi:H+ antiporter protein